MKPGEDDRISALWEEANDALDEGTFTRETWLALLRDVSALVTDENREELDPVAQLGVTRGFVSSPEELEQLLADARSAA